ncbi:MAG: threonine aldolase family protein [Chitinophagaceae bacterium]
MIDFRSDTVTRPTPAMLKAMMEAPVGDDVFGEDPSVNELENLAATLFGRASALFCPSGTMTNQIAIKVHTQPGDELICNDLSHVYIYEGGGIAFNSGVQVRALGGEFGRISASQIAGHINPDDPHKAHTSLVCLENTANRGGGSCYSLQELFKIKELCLTHHLKLHLDGARLFNALVATEQKALDFGQIFDSISICLSKGLGCPVGSLLIGDQSFIQQARRIRKKFGGGMRQAGFLAAAGSFALKHHIKRLQHDHDHARQIADVLKQKEFVGNFLPVQTNILIFEVRGTQTPTTFSRNLEEKGIRVMPIAANQVRMVTHLDITSDMVKTTVQAIREMN